MGIRHGLCYIPIITNKTKQKVLMVGRYLSHYYWFICFQCNSCNYLYVFFCPWHLCLQLLQGETLLLGWSLFNQMSKMFSFLNGILTPIIVVCFQLIFPYFLDFIVDMAILWKKQNPIFLESTNNINIATIRAILVIMIQCWIMFRLMCIV